jgi:hypothetical protein
MDDKVEPITEIEQFYMEREAKSRAEITKLTERVVEAKEILQEWIDGFDISAKVRAEKFLRSLQR